MQGMDDQGFERVREFKYFGTAVTVGNNTTEIKYRTVMENCTSYDLT
jgi:hypothetical protein